MRFSFNIVKAQLIVYTYKMENLEGKMIYTERIFFKKKKKHLSCICQKLQFFFI